MFNVFSEKNFKEFYGQNVFRYRVLGKTVHLWLYDQLTSKINTNTVKADPRYDKRLTALDAEADPIFYFTYFVIATFFTMLSALALLYLFDSGMLMPASELKKISIVGALVVLMGFLEFVITPYDNLTYFFLIIAAFVFCKLMQNRNVFYFVLINCIIILATLNHESALIILSFMMAIYFSHYGFNFKWLKFMIIPFLCYLSVYIGVRIFVHDSGPGVVTEGLKLLMNFFTISGIMGLFFPVIAFFFLSKMVESSTNRKLVWNFLLMASPYILMILVVGKMIEARLWMPVIIDSILLSQLNYKAIPFAKLKKQSINTPPFNSATLA